ncbi:MAG: DEAD/DEAH box helicase [Deltaproteobacteria bacterium]|nr:DEAD/DEAH box helicase [Deltaproteobacteria bacterium]
MSYVAAVPTSLSDRLAASESPADAALDIFLEWVDDTGIVPYPAQEEAVLELFEGHHVLLKTPTGSGKSLVATALHLRAMSLGKRSVYTAPIKALVSEKFRALCDLFGADDVGLMTGDGSVNRDAPILCCTAEILAKIALRHGEETPYDAVIMDEFHYYGDRDRGMAWQLPLLTMPHAQFLLLSATLGDTTAIEADLVERTGHEVAAIDRAERPVPLTFEYSEIPADQALNQLVRHGKGPVYAVHFTQRAASELAQALTSTTFSTDEEKARLKEAVKGFRFDSPFGNTLRKYVLHGVGLHHA